MKFKMFILPAITLIFTLSLLTLIMSCNSALIDQGVTYNNYGSHTVH